MIQRYCDGRIPSGNISEVALLPAKRAGVDTDATTISGFVEHARDEFIRYFEEFAFSRALEEAWAIVARVDKMISDAKPWDLAKDASQRQTLNAVLYRAAESLRWLCVLLYPVMPNATREIYEQVGLSGDLSATDPTKLTWGELQDGSQVGEVKPLFPRIDKAKTMEEIRGEKSEVRDQKSETRPSGRVQSEGVQPETRPSGRVQPSGQHTTEAEAVPGVEGVVNYI